MSRRAKRFPDLAAKARFLRGEFGHVPELRQLADELDPHCRHEDVQLVYQRRPDGISWDDLTADVEKAYLAAEVAAEFESLTGRGRARSIKKAINAVAVRRGEKAKKVQRAWDEAKPDRYSREARRVSRTNHTR